MIEPTPHEAAESPPRRAGRPRGVDIDADGLTARQAAVLSAIRELTAELGYPPSIREIGGAVGLRSTSSVVHQLRALERAGHISQDPHTPRSYRVSTPAAPAPRDVQAPLLGRIAAGYPVTAEQDVSAVLTLPRRVVGAGDVFLLEVVGDSMTGAAILSGDLVAIRRQPDAQNGELVAALIDGEATVKELRRSDGKTWLMPRNPDFEPIPGDHAAILGRVVAVLRRI
ncbi:transcriptional repressor LexA [Kitasatospora purpeofusca]|uniref:transcriptional repressor LexA n=1 Tax=Kitasatospora purpeofusca TaxID=67352 RepID=UPI0035DCD8E3